MFVLPQNSQVEIPVPMMVLEAGVIGKRLGQRWRPHQWTPACSPSAMNHEEGWIRNLNLPT